MYTSSRMNGLLKNIPPVWFISHREFLETYQQELSKLQDNVNHFVGAQNVTAVVRSARSLDRLSEQVCAMEERFRTYLSPSIDEYELYNSNNLSRIKELAASISCSLKTVAKQMSWGGTAELQIAQTQRNLYLLLELIEETLRWIEQGT